MPASEERSISEFPSALSILATTLLLVSTYDSGNDSYDSEKVTAVDLASAILGDFEYTQDLATNVKTIFGAINSIMVLSGTTVPSSDIGSNGQLYFKYSSSGGTDTVDAMYWKINNAWVEVSTGGGGGGASVTLGTTVPSDASGENGDLYVQYEALTYKVVEYFVKINNSWRKSPYSRVVALTQAQYDLITPDAQTLYIITDAQSSYQTKQDSNLQTTANTIVGAINELNTAIYTSAVNKGSYTASWNNTHNITLPNKPCLLIGNRGSGNDEKGVMIYLSANANEYMIIKNTANMTINSWGGQSTGALSFTLGSGYGSSIVLEYYY